MKLFLIILTFLTTNSIMGQTSIKINLPFGETVSLKMVSKGELKASDSTWEEWRTPPGPYEPPVFKNSSGQIWQLHNREGIGFIYPDNEAFELLKNSEFHILSTKDHPHFIYMFFVDRETSKTLCEKYPFKELPIDSEFEGLRLFEDGRVHSYRKKWMGGSLFRSMEDYKSYEKEFLSEDFIVPIIPEELD